MCNTSFAGDCIVIFCGKTEKYKTGIASLEKLAKLIKICGMLLQTKVYLFWEKSEGVN